MSRKRYRESEMYAPVACWLERLLATRHRQANVKVFDVHRVKLSDFLARCNFHKYFPQWNSYDIVVDIVGLIHTKRFAQLAFVECKIVPITIKHIGQVLGYSKVARPLHSFILSPKGVSTALDTLLRSHRRFDVLEYAPARKIRIGKWDPVRREVLASSWLPP